MAPRPHPSYDDGIDDYVLYIAHDHTQEGSHLVKFGITKLEPRERLQAIKGGFRALLRKAKRSYRIKREIIGCYGKYENWTIDRVWRFNSCAAIQEAEKLSVALALRRRGTRPLGNDYVSNMTYAKAEKAVEDAIRRVRKTASRDGFKLQIRSARRLPTNGPCDIGRPRNAPTKPSFG